MKNDSTICDGAKLSSKLLLLACLGIFTNRFLELAILLFSTSLTTIHDPIKFNRKNSLFLICVFLISTFSILINDYSFVRFYQQFFLLLVFVSCYYTLLKRNGIYTVFSTYLYLSCFVSSLGILQFLVYFTIRINIFAFLARTVPVYSGGRVLRINAILSEPSYLSAIITPALFFYLCNHKTHSDRKRLFILLLTLFLTFSTTSYAVFMLMLIYVVYRKYRFTRKIIFVMSIVFFIAIFSSLSNHSINKASEKESVFSDVILKLEDTADSFSDMRPESFELLNLSTYAWISNLWVAIKAPSRLFGTGLGTHGETYYRIYKSSFRYHGLNAQDAYSFGVRVFSEFGILGLFITLIFFLVAFNKENLINESVTFYLITALLRGGNYFLHGFIFFVLVFIFTKKNVGSYRILS